VIPRSTPILVVASILAAADIILSGAALTAYVDVQLIGLLNLVLAGIAAGFGVYLSGRHAPTQNVAVLMSGDVAVAGPASPIPNGEVLAQNLTVEEVVPRVA
jgi:hypothetical protein